MNRRSFLTLSAGAAITAAMPFPFVGKQRLGLQSVRFIRTFDPIQMTMINRFDALYGPAGTFLELPHAVEAASVLNAKPGQQLMGFDVKRFIDNCCDKWIPKGYDELVTTMSASAIGARDGWVHTAWELGEKWASKRKAPLLA